MGRRAGPVTERRIAQFRLAVFVAFVVGAFLSVLLTGGISTERVRDWVDQFGSAAPLVFVITSATLTVCFFPGPILAGCAGLLFGTAAGFPIAMVSALTGACLAFSIARWVAHDAVEELQGPRLARVRDWLGRRGFVAVFTARLMPGIPYNSVNYASGLSPIGIRTFALATAIGAAPRTYAYVSVGGAWGDWTSPQMLGAFAILGIVAAGGVWLARRSDAPFGSPPPTD